SSAPIFSAHKLSANDNVHATIRSAGVPPPLRIGIKTVTQRRRRGSQKSKISGWRSALTQKLRTPRLYYRAA
ncbi:MAG: hypothetical protein WBY73_05820, partial [Candidatus Acidiferrales bacterium]